MTTLGRLLGSLRIYFALTFFLVFSFPIILVYISYHSRQDSWPFIGMMFRAMLRTAGVKLVVEGLDGVDHTRGYLLVGNHVNWLDHFILATIMPTPFVGFEKVENFKVPIYGPMMKRWGNVAVSRSKDPTEAKRVAAEAAALLREGVCFLVYPEGTRTRTGEVGPFKKGGFHTAVDAGAWILPFTYNGAREVLSVGRWWAMPGTVRVTFSKPIDSAAYGRERMDELVAITRDAVLAHYEGQPAALPAAPAAGPGSGAAAAPGSGAAADTDSGAAAATGSGTAATNGSETGAAVPPGPAVEGPAS